MVNLVASIYKPFLCWLMKNKIVAGMTPHTLEIQPGTTLNIWVPSHITIKPPKPAVLLIHGFAADGIVTWQFQVGSLANKYSVYAPDLLFFGRSTTESPDRSPGFQVECLVKGLRKLGVDRCTAVGFSYGGMVAFKMAEMYPEMVSGLAVEMTESIQNEMLERLGYSSFREFLLPTSVNDCKKLLRVAMHMKLWFPRRLYREFLEVMLKWSKEKAELVQATLTMALPSQIFQCSLSEN